MTPTAVAAAGVHPARAVYKVMELAALLRVDHKTLRSEIQAGRIPHVRIGRVIRIPAAVVASMLEQGRVVPPEGLKAR